MPDGEQLSPEGEAYLGRLRKLTDHVDPLVETEAGRDIRDATASLEQLTVVDEQSLTAWVNEFPQGAYTLALSVGLSQEKFKNLLKAEFDTQSWRLLGLTRPADLIAWLDTDYALIDALNAQLGRAYTFGDVLAARGTSRQMAARAGIAGRLIEDAVESIVDELGLPYELRGRFVGQNGNTGPADLAIPNFTDCLIAVACKGFDSTGSKLTAAVTEVQDMANVRYSNQYVYAVVDGIGWASRRGDFRRMFGLAEGRRIDGLYSLADLDTFRDDLIYAARFHRLLT